jgi:FkbM family methyltransferase
VLALKPQVQFVLKQMGLYNRLKASAVYDFYWRVVDKSLVDERIREIDFYRELLNGFRQGDVIFDVGANQGTKTEAFLRLGAKVVAVEPDQANQEILKEKFIKYRFSPKPLVIVGKAVSDRNAVETMWIDEPGSAKNSLSCKWVETLRSDETRFGHSLSFEQRQQIETITLEQLIAAHGLPFFVKIDVEGYELNVLRGLQRSIPYISFEVNLPEFRLEGLQCVELLARLSEKGTFNYSADVSRRGLALEEWPAAEQFSQVLTRCSETSIEVFWKSFSAPAIA